MINFTDLTVGTCVYVVENDPITILELEIISIGYDANYTRRIKVANSEISFEVDFDNIMSNIFIDKDVAYAIATKLVFNETNNYIKKLTDGYFQDYFDLDKAMEKYKHLNPEHFI